MGAIFYDAIAGLPTGPLDQPLLTRFHPESTSKVKAARLQGSNKFSASESETISPVMHFHKKSTFTNNAVSMAAEIIRESSFMQY